jgi:hypothetical protein
MAQEVLVNELSYGTISVISKHGDWKTRILSFAILYPVIIELSG